jgi:hypothetical protein
MTTGEQDDPLIGSKIGAFRIEMRLAAGGMGVVYRATNGLDQEVAVKILAPSLAADQEYVTRFFREAGAAGQIDHPNVVRVIDVGKHDDKYYLVMEFVEGETLDRILDRERRLSLERATRLIREVAAGLAAAHRAGIIHRDVKPGNIIVSRDGKPHLTDFGLARHTETRKGLTIEGTFLGTPEYASPEQVEGRRLDHRTDLYSLGVTYFQLLSGTLPFLGESPMEIAIQRTKQEARPLENAFPGADPRACAIVKKLLHSEPTQRYQNATDLIKDLDAILFGQKPDVVKKGETTRATTKGPLVGLQTKRRVRSFLHWDLLTTGIVLSFLSGGLAARGGEFLETWAAADSVLALRILLLLAGLVAAGGAVFIYRREFASAGQISLLGLLVLFMMLGSLAAGTMIDRSSGASTFSTIASTIRTFIGALGEPVNLLAFGLFFLLTSALVAFEHQPGTHRVVLSRILMAFGFALIYAFGTPEGLDRPLREFMVEAELSIPLATATALACFFAILLLPGYGFEGGFKVFGAFLALGAAIGLFAFATLASQPHSPKGWTALLTDRFADLDRAFRQSGTALVVVFALAVVEQMVVSAGVRRVDRFYSRRKY